MARYRGSLLNRFFAWVESITLRKLLIAHAALEIPAGVVFLIGNAEPLGLNFGGGCPSNTILMRWFGSVVLCSGMTGWFLRDAVPRRAHEAVVYGIALYHAMLTAISLGHRSDFEAALFPVLLILVHGALSIGFAGVAAHPSPRVRPASSVPPSPRGMQWCDEGALNEAKAPCSTATFRTLLPEGAGTIQSSSTTSTSEGDTDSEGERTTRYPMHQTPGQEELPMGRLASCLSLQSGRQHHDNSTFWSFPDSPPNQKDFCHLPEDFGENVKPEASPVVMSAWTMTPDLLDKVSQGDALFGFSCKVGTQMSPTEQAMVSSFINLSVFEDEDRENGVPRLDLHNEQHLREHTFFITKATYILPRARLSDITIDMLSSVAYHQACQPGGAKVWDDCEMRGDVNTFRITKQIIPFVFRMTIQFRCSMVPQSVLPQLSQLADGYQVHKAVLLERTKRTRTNDMTKKCKSLLLYHQLPHMRGLLVWNPTVVANTSVPRVVAAIVDRLGTMGSQEVAETANKTRRFLSSRCDHIL